MNAAAATQVTYSKAELAILQMHLDWYRILHDCSSLQSFQVVHRVPGESETCAALATKGLLKVESVLAFERRELRSYKSVDEAKIDLGDLLKHVTLRPPHGSRSDLCEVSWVSDVLLPGTIANVTDIGSKEIVRLYKEGTLKKNEL